MLVSRIVLNIYKYAMTNSEEAPLFWLQSEDYVKDTIKGVLKNSKDFRDWSRCVYLSESMRESYG